MRDPVEAILAVECLVHRVAAGVSCWDYMMGQGPAPDPLFCASRIRAALTPKHPPCRPGIEAHFGPCSRGTPRSLCSRVSENGVASTLLVCACSCHPDASQPFPAPKEAEPGPRNLSQPGTLGKVEPRSLPSGEPGPTCGALGCQNPPMRGAGVCGLHATASPATGMLPAPSPPTGTPTGTFQTQYNVGWPQGDYCKTCEKHRADHTWVGYCGAPPASTGERR